MEFARGYPEGTIPGSGIAVAPDGRRAAVTTWPNQIWMYTFESSEWRQLPETAGGRQPFWSPDGASVGFFDLHGQVWTVDVNGGSAVRLCDLGPNRLGGSGSWSANGVVLFSAGQRLYRVPASGGNPTQVMVADGGTAESNRQGPQFLADNRHFIYYAENGGSGSAYVSSLDGSPAKRLVDTPYPPRFVAGYLLFVRGTALMAQAFDATTLAVGGPAQIVARNVSPDSLEDWPLFSASSNVLAFAHPRMGNLVWFDRAGTRLGAIPNPPGVEYLNPAISPSGDAVAVNAMDPQTGNWDIWIVDAARGVASRLTSDVARDFDPVWSPDGKEIVFGSDRLPNPGLYRKRVGGSEPEALLTTVDRRLSVTDWSSDGQTLIVTRNASLWGLRLNDRKLFQIRTAPFAEYAARLSPDGHWIAYLSYESGIYEVYVQRFLEPGERKQVSSGGAMQPRWTRDGREIVYPTRAGELMSVPLEFSGSSVRVGAAKLLMPPRVVPVLDSRHHYDVMRNGQRFLVRQTEGQPAAELRVTLNWTEKLKR